MSSESEPPLPESEVASASSEASPAPESGEQEELSPGRQGGKILVEAFWAKQEALVDADEAGQELTAAERRKIQRSSSKARHQALTLIRSTGAEGVREAMEEIAARMGSDVHLVDRSHPNPQKTTKILESDSSFEVRQWVRDCQYDFNTITAEVAGAHLPEVHPAAEPEKPPLVEQRSVEEESPRSESVPPASEPGDQDRDYTTVVEQAEADATVSPNFAEVSRWNEQATDVIATLPKDQEMAAVLAYLREAKSQREKLGSSPREQELSRQIESYTQDLDNWAQAEITRLNEIEAGTRPASDPDRPEPPPQPARVEESPELIQARQFLANERYRQRQKATSVRLGSRLTERADKAQQDLENRDKDFLEALGNRGRTLIAELRERNASDSDIALELAKLALQQPIALTSKEHELQEKKRGGRVSQFWEKLKHNRKHRIAVGLGLTGIGVVGAATGVGGVAIGVMAAKRAWSALGGAGAGTAGYEYLAGRHQKKNLEFSAEATDLSNDDRRRELAAQLNAPNRPESKALDEAARKVYGASLESLYQKVAEALEQDDGAIDRALEAINQEVAAYLKAENEQLARDRKRVWARRGAALLGAAAFAVGLPALTHAVGGVFSGGEHHTASAVGGSEHPPSGVEHTGTSGAGVGHHELHRYGGHGNLYTSAPEVIDQVNAHETAVQAAAKHLNHIAEYRQISDPHARELIRLAVAKDTIKEIRPDGKVYWRIPTESMSRAILNQGG